jgi:hypothetical protein
MCPEPCVAPSESAPPCGFTGTRPLIMILLASLSQWLSTNAPPSPGPHHPTFSIQDSVMKLKPS